jgi:hypothetical protein
MFARELDKARLQLSGLEPNWQLLQAGDQRPRSLDFGCLRSLDSTQVF